MNVRRPALLIAESSDFSPRALELLRERFEVTAADHTRADLVAGTRNAEVLWVRLRTYIDDEVLASFPDLRAVCTNTTGLNHLDLEACERRGVAVISLKGETEFLKEIRATAEATLLLMLAVMRRFREAQDMALNRTWERSEIFANELDGKTVGIVGYGRLGRIVASLCQAFRANVLVTDRKDVAVDAGQELVSLEELLRRSDVVSLHASYTPGEPPFFGADHFASMKPGSWFVNTARGELVDESALLKALESGHLKGAAIDVLAGENHMDLQSHPLLAYARRHANLLITPHIGGATIESTHKTEEFIAGKLLQWWSQHGR